MSGTLRSRTVFLGVSAGLLREAYRVRFRAEGQSMHPTIRSGEIITVEPVTPATVKVGDVVLYRAQRGLVAHRVARIEPGRRETIRFIVRGDSSCSSDDPVEAAQILGLVVSVERAGRSLQLNGRRARLRQALRIGISRLKQGLRSSRVERLALPCLCIKPGRRPQG